MLDLLNIILNQWQFILLIADGEDPKKLGWASSGDNLEEDKEWYALWGSGDQNSINSKVDELFKKTE